VSEEIESSSDKCDLPRRRRSRWRAARRGAIGVAALLALTLGAAGCGSSGDSGKGKLTVADAGFTESQLLADMYGALLDKAGYQVERTSVKSTEIAQSSLESGDVDAMPQYVATYADLLNVEVNGKNAASVSSPDLQKSLAALTPLAARKGLTALDPAQAVDQNAFAVSRSYAQQHNLRTLSDLGASGLTVRIAAGSECATRPFCQIGLQKTYGIKVSDIVKTGVDTAQTKAAVRDGKAELGLVLTTDATVDDFNLVVLTDDKKLQNADNVVPIVTTKSLTPDISTALNRLAPVLTTADLAALDKKVDAQRQKPSDVARQYLRDKGLL
jgi:osmoprotectant transport system substrate-binding protein